MSEQDSSEKVVKEIYAYAAEQLNAGSSPGLIKIKLTERGLDAQSASIVVDNLFDAQEKMRKKASESNMVLGGFLCFGGIAFTAFTYYPAQPGNRYITAWGAILYGAYLFVKGWAIILKRCLVSQIFYCTPPPDLGGMPLHES